MNDFEQGVKRKSQVFEKSILVNKKYECFLLKSYFMNVYQCINSVLIFAFVSRDIKKDIVFLIYKILTLLKITLGVNYAYFMHIFYGKSYLPYSF